MYTVQDLADLRIKVDAMTATIKSPEYAAMPQQQRTLLREQLEATDKLSVLVGELINMGDGLVTSRPPSNSNEDEL
ncbi:hypothetical protein PGS49_20975 [Yersinia intermedia]|uniref:hypothetical protein n=1 Tax=Yersinia intermedia TaxID=631 RepID=UPI0022FE41E9|nr:hypothetical protein [Yersinia intermedia]MDA5483095.1 hypothetical protein [Yersinia intermedia]